MRTQRLLLVLVLAMASATRLSAQQPASARAQVAAFVDSLLSRMTLEEKLGQLTQLSDPDKPGSLALVRAGRVGSFLYAAGAAEASRVQRVAVEHSRLKIPLLYGYDVIHGFRTIFPVPLAEAATWDTAGVREASRIAALEATAAGVAWTFAPMVDIARDPRWGRIVEGAGEDPYLGAAFAAARVRGFQGDDLADPTRMMATAKHFAAYGAAEGGRDYNTVDVSERTLRETYLPPFRAAVAAGAGSLMASFNEIAGVPSHANRWLLTDVLRGEWGFAGMVVSDWDGIAQMVAHGLTNDTAEAGRLALEAGVDMDMADSVYIRFLPDVDRRGRLSREALDEAVRRVLRAKYRLGLFRDPFRGTSPARERAVTLANANLALAREEARKAIVLLKNDNVLPLRKDLRSIAVIGPLAEDAKSEIGPWGARGQEKDVVSILEGIRRAVPSTRIEHVQGAPVDTADTTGFAAAERVARAADAVILVLGESAEMSGEASSRASIELPGVQSALALRVLAAAAGKPVAVLLANGRPLAVPELAARAPALLETWFLGVQAGPAVADVLFGDVAPSGKLPVTFPRATGQIPIHYDHKNTGRPPTDDKWTSKYLDVDWTPLFPFGHGLSYATFRYGPVRLSAASMGASDTLVASVDVTNARGPAGDEVVQLYLRDEAASITRPVKQLRGFSRISLQPGQTKTVSFRLTADDLAFWGADMHWRAEPGWFTVYVGGSSERVQEARFELR